MPALAPPPVNEDHLYIAAIAEALHASRLDVLLEPIMGLGDLRASHYEVSIRLLDPAGGALDVTDGGRRLSRTTLLPMLDRARLSRSASVARRLSERGKQGAVFTGFSGEALTDEGFVAGAGESCRDHPRLPGQLVLTFMQDDLRMATEVQLRCLAHLRAMGFRFAMSDVTELDMDFEQLVAMGFAFVKLDADVFLDGLRAAHGTIPARDICSYLSGLGLTLVVSRIDSETERSRLHAFGVKLGQGGLFGGPRPLKTDVLSGTRGVAA
jgi:cyclic-di-GMP phosphodiesterase TipF (flagellum assembly factor)